MQYIGKLDISKLGEYKEKLITNEVVLTRERLYEHILICHKEDYTYFKEYIQEIVENPDYIIEDNKHEDTMIFLKEIKKTEKRARIVIKLALGKDKNHPKNSIITLMKLNERTWKQTINNRGKIIWKSHSNTGQI